MRRSAGGQARGEANTADFRQATKATADICTLRKKKKWMRRGLLNTGAIWMEPQQLSIKGSGKGQNQDTG